MFPYHRDLEGPQQPEADPDWQESVCLWFLDLGQDVGGFFRIGRHPELGHARVHLFVFSGSSGARVRLSRQSPPLEPRYLSDRGFEAEGLSYEVERDHLCFAWSREESEASLIFRDFYTPRDWGHSEYSRRAHSGGHLEVAGSLTGNLRIGREEIVLAALAHRDRSWGTRRTRSLLNHRMVTGTTGPALSFATLVVHFREQPAPTHMGFVVRDGVATDVTGFDIVTGLDVDGMTVRTGSCSLGLASGQRIAIQATARDGQLNEYENLVSSDNLCSVVADGRPGFCNFEITNNPLCGATRPSWFSDLCATEGLSRRVRQG